MYVLYYIEVTFLYTQFVEGFYHVMVLNFVKYFSSSTEMSALFLSVILFMYIHQFADVEPPLQITL